MATGGQGWGLEFYDCVLNNDLARLEILVNQHKIDLNAKFTEVRNKNHLDLSPIHLVAYKGYAGMLQYLFDMKCDIHLTTAVLHRTAFHFAVLNQKMACFHKLLSFGANADTRDTFGNTACHYAAEDGAIVFLDVLLRCKSVHPNAQDITGKTPLMKATRNGKIEAVKRLLAARCLPNIRDKNSDTALHFAARHGNTRLLVTLTAAGSDLNMQNQWGHTPLMETVFYNNKDAAAHLLEVGCDVNLREFKSGDTALHVAVRKNYTVITEQLLATGHVKHVYNYQGELAIHDAVFNQKMDTVRLFIRYNYDLDLPCKLDYDGSGGKHVVRVALERENLDLLRLLARIGYLINFSVPVSSFLPPSAGAADSMPVATPSGATSPVGGLLGNFEGGGATSGTAVQRIIAELSLVRSLKSICRKIIRKPLGYGIHDKVRALPLPPRLSDYLLLADVLDEH